MKNSQRILPITSLILACINITWWAFNALQYLDFPKFISQPAIYHILVAWGWIILFVSHLVILFTVVFSLKYSQRLFLAGLILITAGIISFIFLMLHMVGVMEIGNEYPQGYPIDGMVRLVWTSQYIHLAFLLYTLMYLLILKKISARENPRTAVFKEQIFVALHITGLVSGIVGLLWVLLFMNFDAKHHLRSFDVIPYGFIILPYLLVLCSLWIAQLSDNRPGWFDEKQRSDLYRSGMIAFLFPLPIIIYITLAEFMRAPELPVFIDGTVTILWLPLYVFLTLLVFSASTLYNFRKN